MVNDAPLDRLEVRRPRRAWRSRRPTARCWADSGATPKVRGVAWSTLNRETLAREVAAL